MRLLWREAQKRTHISAFTARATALAMQHLSCLIYSFLPSWRSSKATNKENQVQDLQKVVRTSFSQSESIVKPARMNRKNRCSWCPFVQFSSWGLLGLVNFSSFPQSSVGLCACHNNPPSHTKGSPCRAPGAQRKSHGRVEKERNTGRPKLRLLSHAACS